MHQLLHFIQLIAISSVALLFALPAAAAADDDYVSALSREASGDSQVLVATGRVRPSYEAGSSAQVDPDDVKAARLGIITPYGKNALVQELRAYYPASYRSFRGLDRGKVQVLVDAFKDSGDVTKVLSLMDGMVQ